MQSRREFVASVSAASALVVSGSTALAAENVHTLRLNLTDSINSVSYAAASSLAQAVQRRSNGRLKIQLFPNLELANENETIQALQSGVIDLSIQNVVQIDQLVPEMQVLNLPFLFKNVATAFRVLDGPIGNELIARLFDKGIVGLGWGSPGFKELETRDRAVRIPSDLHGLRIRIPSSDVYAQTYQALGATPMTISYNETFVALEQHAIDAVDLSLEAFISQKMYTLLKNISMTNHFFAPYLFMASKSKMAALPPDLQSILRIQSKMFVATWRRLAQQAVDQNLAFIRKNGVSISNIDYAAFLKVVEPVYAELGTKIGGDFLMRTTRAVQTDAVG